MVDGVAQQMDDRIADLVEHRPIQLDLLAIDVEGDLLAERLRGVAHETREPIEDLPDGHHSAGHDLVLQIPNEPGRLMDGLRQRLVFRAGGQRDETAPGNHQLPDEVHQRIEAPKVDANVRAGARMGIVAGDARPRRRGRNRLRHGALTAGFAAGGSPSAALTALTPAATTSNARDVTHGLERPDNLRVGERTEDPDRHVLPEVRRRECRLRGLDSR